MEETTSSFEQSPFGTQTTSTSTKKGPRKGKKLIFLVIIIIILAAIAFGAIQILGIGGGATPTPTPTPTIEQFVLPTEEPSPTEEEKKEIPTPTKGKASSTSSPTPTKASSTSSGNTTDSATGLDRTNLSIVIQNGSGEAGVAGVLKSKLEELGYKVASTGNADNFDYANTQIQVKSTKKDYIPLLKKDLSGTYTIGSATSDYSGDGDALIIIGKE